MKKWGKYVFVLHLKTVASQANKYMFLHGIACIAYVTIVQMAGKENMSDAKKGSKNVVSKCRCSLCVSPCLVSVSVP